MTDSRKAACYNGVGGPAYDWVGGRPWPSVLGCICKITINRGNGRWRGWHPDGIDRDKKV